MNVETTKQKYCVRQELKKIVALSFMENYEIGSEQNELFVDAIFNDVVEDINNTADWSNLEENDYVPCDVFMSFKRVVFERVTEFYSISLCP